MEKILGIIGGLGPETSCSFCLNVNNGVKKVKDVQPQIIMENVPMSDKALGIIAHGGFCAEVLGLLVDSVKRLNRAGVDVIVIPCNTVHVFINDLRKISDVPVLSIIEETAKECSAKSFQKVGILGSSTTIKERLYATELQKCGIELITPNNTNQQFISNCIIKIINQNFTPEDKQKMKEIIEKFKNDGAQAVILGCSDLFLIISQEDTSLPLINSTSVLEKATIENLLSQKVETR